MTLAEAKTHLRLEHGMDDAYLTGITIPAARAHIEEVCWRGLVTQTWELVLDEFPDADEVKLPYGNLASVTSVSYVDDDGATQTLATTEYVTDTASEPGRILLAYDKSWPTTRAQWDAVVIRYVVGWAVASVPAPIKHAALLLISQMYEHRTPEVAGTIVSEVRFAVDALLGPYRLVEF